MSQQGDWWGKNHSQCYSHALRKRRSKTDWAGVGIGDAFKNNLDYYTRLTAQRCFYKTVKKAQKTVANLTGRSAGTDFETMTKPQLGPCYTTYPSILSSNAAIGLTAFLEYKARSKVNILHFHLKDYLKDPARFDRVEANKGLYKYLAKVVTESVQNRLLLEDLSRLPAMASIEVYRLFSASQQPLKFISLPEIIRAVILYGDVLPGRHLLNIHFLTHALLKKLTTECEPFFARLPRVKSAFLSNLGTDWVRKICLSLAPYVLWAKREDQGDTEHLNGREQQYPQKQFSQQASENVDSDIIAPLDAPIPVFLMNPERPENRVLAGAGDGMISNQKKMETLEEFGSAINQASKQQKSWEDIRSDLVERDMGWGVFRESPIEGSPVEGHEVKVNLGEGLDEGGVIFDRPVPLSNNLPAYEKLMNTSWIFTEALKRNLYPNMEEVPETERLRTGGSLDPARLAMADVSSVIFRRYRIRERADRRGRPELVIACDGSGSLNPEQMAMVKILASGWLNATAKSRIQVLAGLYHSGRARGGSSGPLVQWIYHPRKTPAISRQDAARALVSLPDNGTGVQSDALSLSFILEEAKKIAMGNMIYFIVLSDIAWNRSFNTEMEGKEEVYSFFQNAYEQLEGKLHTTLVGLGVSGKTGFEDLLDKVITVSSEELHDSSTVAEKIGLYVAACMKERSRVVNRR
jgi:hypothetical protein